MKEDAPKQVSAETLHRMEEAIRSLRPLHREIFFLHRFDNLSYPEIAGRLGISIKKVERGICAAIVALTRARRGERPRRWRLW